jgi:DNA polymerase III delta prime subunit
MTMFDNLWVEKYRPSTLDEIVLTEDNREVFQRFAEDEDVPNLLFVGNAGIGKTSLAKIITKDILKCQYLYINASDENGIDTIRTKVVHFAKTRSLDGKIKIIILDEVDGLTMDAQRALRNTMEEYSSVTRFILTANYKHRVITPLQSRVQSFDLTPPIKECIKRVSTILKSEKVEVSQDQKVLLVALIKNYYPDFRKVINEVQRYCNNGKIDIKNITVLDTFVENIFKLIQSKKVLMARKLVIENEDQFNNDHNGLLKAMFNYAMDSNLPDVTKKKYLLILAEHLYRAAFVMDPEINFFSCCIALEESG